MRADAFVAHVPISWFEVCLVRVPNVICLGDIPFFFTFH